MCAICTNCQPLTELAEHPLSAPVGAAQESDRAAERESELAKRKTEELMRLERRRKEEVRTAHSHTTHIHIRKATTYLAKCVSCVWLMCYLIDVSFPRLCVVCVGCVVCVSALGMRV